jgi:hypothetical protein
MSPNKKNQKYLAIKQSDEVGIFKKLLVDKEQEKYAGVDAYD